MEWIKVGTQQMVVPPTSASLAFSRRFLLALTWAMRSQGAFHCLLQAWKGMQMEEDPSCALLAQGERRRTLHLQCLCHPLWPGSGDPLVTDSELSWAGKKLRGLRGHPWVRGREARKPATRSL